MTKYIIIQFSLLWLVLQSFAVSSSSFKTRVRSTVSTPVRTLPIYSLDALQDHEFLDFEEENSLEKYSNTNSIIEEKHQGYVKLAKDDGKITNSESSLFTVKENSNLHYQGSWYFSFSFPLLSLTHSSLKSLSSNFNSISKVSVFGQSFGAEYYYKPDRFVNISAGVAWAGPMFHDICYEEYDWNRFESYSITLSNNHRNNWYSFGYGLSYFYNNVTQSKYQTDVTNFDSHLLLPHFSKAYDREDKRYSKLGLYLNSQIYLTEFLSFGLSYKPSLINLKSLSGKFFNYEHQITFDLLFKIQLNPRKK